MLLFNSISFLETEPQFMCQLNPPSTEWTYTNHTDTLVDQYCSGEYNCQINWNSRLSIYNTLYQVNFLCAPGWQIGLIGSLFLVGIVVGCSFVTRLGDVYGRRPVYASGMFTNFLSVIIIVITMKAPITITCMFLLGMSITARYYVGYTYNLEYQPKYMHVTVSIIQFSAESIVYILNIVYFRYISNDWVWLQIPNIVLSGLGVCWILLLPETPRYLCAKKRYDDTRNVLSKLARWNGITDARVDEWVFDKEAEDIRIAAETPIGVQRANEEEDKAPSVSWRDIWAVPVLRQNLWAAILLYCEGTFNFYLLTFYIKYFPGNLFVNNLYFACSDLIAFFMAGTMLHYLSLKTAIRVGATIAFIGGVLYMTTSQVQDLIPIMVCFSRMG